MHLMVDKWNKSCAHIDQQGHFGTLKRFASEMVHINDRFVYWFWDPNAFPIILKLEQVCDAYLRLWSSRRLIVLNGTNQVECDGVLVVIAICFRFEGENDFPWWRRLKVYILSKTSIQRTHRLTNDILLSIDVTTYRILRPKTNLSACGLTLLVSNWIPWFSFFGNKKKMENKWVHSRDSHLRLLPRIYRTELD